MEPRPTPALPRIVQQDYVALLSVLGPAALWFLYLTVDVLGFARRPPPPGAEATPFFLYVAPVATVLGLAGLVARVRGVRRLFREGLEVEGRITAVQFMKDRGRVDFVYVHAGQEHASWRALHRTERTEALRQGQAVVVLVDPARPTSALLRDLYV